MKQISLTAVIYVLVIQIFFILHAKPGQRKAKTQTNRDKHHDASVICYSKTVPCVCRNYYLGMWWYFITIDTTVRL